MVKAINMDHVERLSRGQRSGARIGSRTVGHHLRQHERATYERALRHGYLTIYEHDRANLWHIWEKACLAQQQVFLVLVKQPGSTLNRVYREHELVFSGELELAKHYVQQQLEC